MQQSLRDRKGLRYIRHPELGMRQCTLGASKGPPRVIRTDIKCWGPRGATTHWRTISAAFYWPRKVPMWTQFQGWRNGLYLLVGEATKSHWRGEWCYKVTIWSHVCDTLGRWLLASSRRCLQTISQTSQVAYKSPCLVWWSPKFPIDFGEGTSCDKCYL